MSIITKKNLVAAGVLNAPNAGKAGMGAGGPGGG